MSGPRRLPPTAPARFGTEIDRSEPVGFKVGATPHGGLYGDTVSSALAAAGVARLGTSALLGRPRGLMALGLEDHMPAALDSDDGPWSLTPGSEIPLREGLRVRGPAGGLKAALRGLGPMPAPDRRALPPMQQIAERLRRTLPLPGARLPAIEPPPFARAQTCGALVIGAGLAGLAAAAALRSAGVEVHVIDASGRPGGAADLYDGAIDGRPLAQWAAAQAAGLRDRDALSLSATALSIEPDGSVVVLERDDPLRPGRLSVRLASAGAVVVAVGHRERPLIFPDNDRPGIMLATTARALLRRHAVAPGARVVVATTSDEGHRAAIDLKEAGVDVALVLDARDNPQGPAVDLSKAVGAPVSLSTVVVGVDYDERKGGLTGVRAQNRFGEGAEAGARMIEADALVVSGGLAPRDELLRRSALSAEHGVYAASGPNAAEAVAAGWAAGVAAARRLGAEPAGQAPLVEASADELSDPLPLRRDAFFDAGARSAFVDFGADVTLADIARAAERRGAAPAAVARNLGLALGPEGGRLSADWPSIAFSALTGFALKPPAAGRATLATLAARAKLRGD